MFLFLKRSFQILCILLFLNSCASLDMDSLKMLVNDPYKDLTIADTYRVSANAVIKSAKCMADSIQLAIVALEATEIKAEKYLGSADSLSRSNQSIGAQLKGAQKIGQESTNDAKVIIDKLNSFIEGGFKLSKEAKQKMKSSYNSLIKGSVQQAWATKGGISFSKKINAADASKEIQNAIADKKLGVTMEDIQAFPKTVKTYATNFKNVFEIANKMREISDLKGDTDSTATELIQNEEENVVEQEISELAKDKG